MPAPLPNFLIAGAARAGTTSLHHWLSDHPQVFLPADKEPSFFVHGHGLTDWKQYCELFEPGHGAVAIGEASAAYLAAPESPAWISQVLPNTKIILILRDPVQRAFSLYNWMVMHGYEPMTTFEKALEAEPARRNDPLFPRRCLQYHFDYYYRETGLYAQQVRRYLDSFERARMLIVLFDDMIARPGETFAQICRFLGVDDTFTPSFEAQNAGRRPWSVRLQHALRRIDRGAGPAHRRVQRLVRALMDRNCAHGAKPHFKPATEAMLRESFREEVLELSQLIQRDLGRWLSGAPTRTQARAA